MMLKYPIILLLVLLSSCDKKQTSFPEIVPGVSEELASFRRQQIDSVVYDLHFEIPAALADSIPAQLNLSLHLNNHGFPVVLDFQPNHDYPIQGLVNGREVSLSVDNEHLVIPLDVLKKGKNDIQVNFIAGERSLNRNKNYLFSLLVPDRARTLFPCFDQPNLKARYQLEVTTPIDWQVLGPSVLEKANVKTEQKTYRFVLSEPMSTYLFSFVAGTFDVEENKDINFPMTLFHMETDSIKTAMSVSKIFELHQQSKDFLERYTERKFPFQKLDFAAIYSHPYGGMEHVGAIQYLQQSMFLDSTATERQELSRAKLIAHETAHMWFGDLVTMKWFDDVWMKEVFANFMADKIVNPIFTDIDHELQFLTGHYPTAFGVDRTSGANPIRQHLENLNNAGSLYGSIIYHKAPIMMRQLEALLGEEAFRKGLAAYINAYPYGNADWNDLITLLDAQSPLDLMSWSEVWVNSSSRPIFTAKLDTEKGSITNLEINQRAEQGEDRLWPQVFEIILHYPDSEKRITVTSTAKNTSIREVIGLPEPISITYNSNGMGYGVFPLNKDLEAIPSLEDHVARGQSYINLYENALNGTIDIQRTVDLLQKGIQQESNELILGLITGYMGNLYWTYSSEGLQKDLQPSLQDLLFTRLQKDEPSNIKKTLFNLYKSISHKGKGLERLFEIWNKELSIPNLKLNKDDYTSLAMSLALYGHPQREDILDEAEAALDNPNKLERFQFLKPALSDDAEVRSEFFKSFSEEKNREKERWVSTACRYIHHPLHQQESIEEVHLSLELLEEIQATGDIFFPKSWLDATIGQYTSKRAWQITEAFLEAHPNIDTKLRAKILQATDDLFRSSQLLGKN